MKTIDNSNNANVRKISMQNGKLVLKGYNTISFDGDGKKQLLAIIESLGEDFRWTLECSPPKVTKR